MCSAFGLGLKVCLGRKLLTGVYWKLFYFPTRYDTLTELVNHKLLFSMRWLKYMTLKVQFYSFFLAKFNMTKELQKFGGLATTTPEQDSLIYKRKFTPFTQNPKHMVNICVSKRGNFSHPCFQCTTPSTESPPRICHLSSFGINLQKSTLAPGATEMC